ncbi:MAG TPA: 16S rRNA (cytosine(1402)-N(4))-methyltransferase RsmH [Bacillota bacterium]|nr:16S rRNA (cytosine(1402)-N(4))-methyltransferase RsmH [Bacillota bacterium]
MRENGIYVDCTLGGGGHTSEILRRLGGTGRVIAFDRDEEAVENAKKKFGQRDDLTIIHDNFVNVRARLEELGVNSISGATVDLGVSSYQLDNAERGFSYMADAPLDMRMDSTQALSAYTVVNSYSEDELVRILYEYGQERYARRIAGRICQCRSEAPILTTLQLSALIKECVGRQANDSGHPAKRTFQAIRIEVNSELSVIEPTLRELTEMLEPGGRIAVITFHSLEDRIVKQTFASLAQGCTCPKDFPICVCGKKPEIKLITKKPTLPSCSEVEDNSRSHSAKLRTAQKL